MAGEKKFNGVWWQIPSPLNWFIHEKIFSY